MSRVLLLGGEMYHPEGVRMLRAAADVSVVAGRAPTLVELEGADVIFARYPTAVDRAIMENAPSLLAVCSSGRGVDKIDIEAATELGIAVINNPGLGGTAVAEHTIGMVIALARDLPACTGDAFDAAWRSRHDAARFEVSGKIIGLVGFGHVGRAVAVRARALGMRVLAYDPYVAEDLIRQNMAEPVTELTALISQSRFVSIHAELTPANWKMIDTPVFRAFQPGSYFLNTARGGLVDAQALADSLQPNGPIAGAALDVYPEEPLPRSSPLRSHKNVILTPHIAGMTAETRHALSISAATQILQVLSGIRPAGLLNPEVLPGGSRLLLQRADRPEAAHCRKANDDSLAQRNARD